MSLKGIIFDSSTLLEAREPVIRDLIKLLEMLGQLDLCVIVFSTEPVDVNGVLETWGRPPVDLQVNRIDVGKAKGSPLWIEKACEELGLSKHELIYVGDTEIDWRTAINSAVMYINAEWTKQNMPQPAFRVASPREVWVYLSHFFLQPPRWQYSIDAGEDEAHHIRVLLNAAARLPSEVSSEGEVTGEFTLQQVLTYARDIEVGESSARNLLMMHALSSLYLEGLIPPGILICPYPSHKAGTSTGILDDWLTPAAKLFHGWYKSDLLVRAFDAPDTSLLRWKGNAATPEMQMSTVHVNPTYRNQLSGKTVVLLDDFTTDGTSLEWGKNLLHAAGVARAILVTIGKYGQKLPIRHTSFRPKPGVEINAFEPTYLAFHDVFQASTVHFQESASATVRLVQSMKYLAADKAYPLRPSGGRRR